ncbi:MAG: hypothetical protein J6Q58_00570 [Clostridia bacterium]|nr:hypothetical protein [Clostridia bacterium]
MELKLADLEKENPKYLRKDIDGGIISEKQEIDRYKLEQYIDVVDNLLLGNYNEFGHYEIEEEIVKELIDCRKVIEDNFENLLFLKSESALNAFSNLHFVVRVTESEKPNFNKATLELLEPIYKVKGYIENTQATVLKKVVLENNAIFKDEVYKAFNIIVGGNNTGAKRETIEEVSKVDSDKNFKNVIDRKVKLLYVKEKTENAPEYETYHKQNVEELSKTNEGKLVLENYKKDLVIAKKYLNIKENDFKSRSELLLKTIERLMPKMPAQVRKNFTNLNNKIVNRINNVIIVTKPLVKPKNVVKVKKETKLDKMIYILSK